MKKLLLATTALGAFVASSAIAAGPSVTVGGSADFQIGGADQDTLYDAAGLGSSAGAADTRDTKFRSETEINISVEGKSDNGLGYGAVIELLGDQNGASDDGSADANADKSYIFVESGLGRVELGGNSGATQAMQVNAGSFARATGGINGDFYKFVNLSGTKTQTAGAAAGNSTATAHTFVVTPELPGAALPGARAAAAGGGIDLNGNGTFGDEVTEDANKITYYSPRLEGFQLGVSYSPDLGDNGNAGGFTGNAGAATGAAAGEVNGQNVWDAGLAYTGEYENVGIQASAVGQWGEQEENPGLRSGGGRTNRDDIAAYELGLALSFAGLTVGGSIAEISEYGRLEVNEDSASYFTLGAAYEYGPFAASVTYLDSESGNGAPVAGTATTDIEFNNLVVGADYQLAPGLVPYVEVSFFDTDDGVAATTDNDGTLVILGTGLNF